MVRFQTSSKELYGYYLKEDRVSGCCTNKRALEIETMVGYNTFRRVFDRRGEDCYEDERVIIIRIRVSRISKGRQSLSRRGKGGMEKFAMYINKGSDY